MKLLKCVFLSILYFVLCVDIVNADSTVTCEYKVPYNGDSYLKMKFIINGENDVQMFYMKNKEEKYYESDFAKLLYLPTIFGNGTSMANDIGSTIDAESVYYAYTYNGYKCPYIITTHAGGNITLSVSDDSYHDGVNSFSSELINADYGDDSPEQVEVEKECVSHLDKNSIPEVQGVEFYFRIYEDGKREFCAKLQNMAGEPSCNSFDEASDDSGTIRLTDPEDSHEYRFMISSTSIADFYADTCVGSDFYIYEEAGYVEGSYILTTDEEEAGEGTYDTPGEEGAIKDPNDSFSGNICEGDNCDISFGGFCNEPNVARTFKFLGLGFFVLKILVPAIIIIMGIVNLFKIITSGKEDEAKKYAKIVVRNVVIGIVIFLAPTLINFLYDTVKAAASISDNNSAEKCVDCILDPLNCEVK